jgi:hypothetical protein
MKFIPTKARAELNKLNDESSNGVQDLIFRCYNYALEYLDLREESSDGAPVFNWIDLYSVPKRNEIKKAYDIMAAKFGETFKRIINGDNIFEEFCLVKMSVKERCSEWRQRDSTYENIWGKICTHFNMKNSEHRISSI